MACGVRAWNLLPLMAIVPEVEPIFALEILNEALAPPLRPMTAAVLSSTLRAWAALAETLFVGVAAVFFFVATRAVVCAVMPSVKTLSKAAMMIFFIYSCFCLSQMMQERFMQCNCCQRMASLRTRHVARPLHYF